MLNKGALGVASWVVGWTVPTRLLVAFIRSTTPEHEILKALDMQHISKSWLPPKVLAGVNGHD